VRDSTARGRLVLLLSKQTYVGDQLRRITSPAVPRDTRRPVTLRSRRVAAVVKILESGVVHANNDSDIANPNDKFDDEDYPAYSMGSAARILGSTPAFLRSLDEAKLLAPQRSEGGHRRYSRYQLRIASRVRDMLDHGTALEAACRIIILEDQLAHAHAMNAELHRTLDDQHTPSTDDPVP
jgi:DNA-binding transcriptional MerR regulator